MITTMKSGTLSLLLTTVSCTCIAQQIQKEINEHVWRVQLAGMNSNQADTFISVMSDDVIQVSYDRHKIRGKEEFYSQAVSTYKRIKDRKLSRTMEFRFLNRIANEKNAFEDGFYKYELTNEHQEKEIYYGYFQVVLRKENQFWKVLVDYDSEKYNGTPVTKDLFDNARPLDSFENR
jgi:ketosteroid isomerase-like protein